MTFDMLNRKAYSVKKKSVAEEKRFAKRHGGRPTPMSGATATQKADVVFKGVRLEHKETDKSSISIKKDWLDKLENGTNLSEVPALAVKIQDKTWIMIRESEFDFILQKVKEDRYGSS